MIIDGKKISAELLEKIKNEVALLPARPLLIDVLVGEDPVTESYVKIKSKRAAETGIDFEIVHLPADIAQQEIESKIEELNRRENLAGLIIQLPLPENLVKQSVLDTIMPEFDVDVVTSANLGKLWTGQPLFVPATAGAVMEIIRSLNFEIKGKNILVVGSGDLVGKPAAFLCMQAEGTVTVANRSTSNLKELALKADLIISGAGSPGLITAEMVKDGAVIIDAGTAESGGAIKGDADFEGLKDKTMVTPVPGGVGPVTVAMLLNNVLEAAKRNQK